MVLEPKSSDLPLGSSQIFQVGDTDFSTSRVSSALPLGASDLFASDNVAVSKVILSSNPPELQSLNVRETITVQDIMSTPATTEWLSSTLQTFTPGLWTRTSRISEVDPTSSISDDIFPSEINQYWSQNVEIFTAGVSLTETESFRPLRSSDIFHESPNVTRYMFSSPSSSVFETINLSSTSRAFTSSSVDFSVPNSSVQDVYIASLSQVESQDYETTASSFVTLTPTLSTVDLLKSLSLELNTLDESSVLTLSDSSISPTFIIDVSETSQLEASSKLSNQVAFSLSPTRTVSESIFSDVFTPASSVISDLTPTLASEILHPTPFRHTNETSQSLTASTNIQIETIPFTRSTAVVATVLNISSAYSLPSDINTIGATPTISLTAEYISSTALPEKSLSTVEPSSMPNTTSPVLVVAPLVDVTFAFKFRVDGQCLRLRQAPYSRHFKTSLARTLLHITHLKSSSGSKVRVEEAQCNTNPHIISVSFFKIDKHSLIQAINFTHTFYGNKHKKFTLPIVIKFSTESKAFVVNITGFEEIKGLGQTKSKSSIFGMDTAAIATAACLCVVLVCVGTCVFAREMYLKRRVGCMDVSERFSHVPTYNIKEKAAELTHTSGMYKGGKTGIDNPALCSSVYNDIEMTEVYLDDTEGDDDSSYYNPYDVEYSSIGNNFMVEFDAFGTSGKLHGIMNSAFSLSSVEDISTTSNVDELPKHDGVESRRQAIKQPPPPRNYGLVIGLLGYNKQQAQQPRQDERVPLSMNTKEQIPKTSYEKQHENQDHKNQGTSVEDIYTVPMKYPRKSRRNSRKRPSLQVMMSDPGSATETSLSVPRVHRGQKPSPVAPPRRQKRAPRSQQEQRRAKADDRNSQRGGKAKRSASREDSTRSGQENRSFVEDEVYAVISGSTQSFHF
ncbi:hypothetical protein EGW08_003554 [Elysia chlorotica]|uniref:Uncharacterized protein n=1 Tax=Elysia chlorotica TaxID=188477 RepID=A0A3S1BPW8_ELYCH|nr:hypothetical protein EGW08_003554 [Elysia chlorotica]